MEMPTLSPLALILLTALVSALAGYHVGKASGLRAAERAYRLTEKNTTQADPASAAKSAKGREKVVPAAVESGGEEDWESEDEDGEDSDVETVDVKKFENNHEPCKMVGFLITPSPLLPHGLFLYDTLELCSVPETVANAQPRHTRF